MSAENEGVSAPHESQSIYELPYIKRLFVVEYRTTYSD